MTVVDGESKGIGLNGSIVALAQSLDLYKRMATIRAVEQRLLTLFSQGHIQGTVHTCLGQEACAVGVVDALDRERDVVWSNHRGHGHFLAYCDDVDGLIAEIMGRESGVCGGIGGSQHLQHNNYYSNGILGGIAPIAVGCAMAEKHTNSGAVAVVFLGDGAMAEGAVSESMNIAALWNLPVLFVLENNGWAQSTPTHLEHAGDLASRANTYDIATTELRATDVHKIRDATSTIVEQMRVQPAPQFLVLNTYRLGAHSKGDDDRPVDDVQAQWAVDPLTVFRKELAHHDESAVMNIDNEIDARVDNAVAAAMASPAPSVEDFENRRKTW